MRFGSDGQPDEHPSRASDLPYRLVHEHKRGTSRLILLRGTAPVAASQPVRTEELEQWMRRYEVPFTGLLRTGWTPHADQWTAILRRWFPDLDQRD
jgi:hypothetical protein